MSIVVLNKITNKHSVKSQFCEIKAKVAEVQSCFSFFVIWILARLNFAKTNLSLGDQGVIQSPDYPQAYTANIDCLWLLETANLEDRIYLDCDAVELGKTFSSNWVSRLERIIDLWKSVMWVT